MFGLDYTNVSPQIAKQLGAKFVCRYVGYFSGYNINTINVQQGKCLYTAEASELLSDGIDIVSNFEWYAMRPSIHDSGSASASFAAGQWDARVGNAIHIGCGGPSTAPIYFSVDYQTDGSDTVDYFNGVASVIGLARIGGYGGYDCIKFLFDRKLITYGWQTYAWSNGQWDSRAHIHQYSNGNKTAGGEVDYNDSVKPNFGSWRTHMTFLPDYFTTNADGTITCIQSGIQVYGNIQKTYMACADPLSEYGLPTSGELALPKNPNGEVYRMFERGDIWYDPNSLNDTITHDQFGCCRGHVHRTVTSTVTSDEKAVAAKTALQAWLAE